MPLKKSTDIFDYVGHLKKAYGKYRRYTNGEFSAIEAINKLLVSPENIVREILAGYVSGCEWIYTIKKSEYDKNIHFIKFEDLSLDPEKEMKKLYNYLGFEYFPHHFTNMEQFTHENDIIHGIFGDHKIRPNVEPLKDDYTEILGKEQSDRIRNHYDWFYKRFNYL